MGNSGPLHLETLDGPVACRNGPCETGCDEIAVLPQLDSRIKLAGSVRFTNVLLDRILQIVIEALEQIFEKQRQ